MVDPNQPSAPFGGADDGRRLELTIDSSLDHLSLITSALQGICEDLGFDQEGSLEIELCAVEALTNAIVHGYCGESGHRVRLTVDTAGGELQLRIVDAGHAIPPKARRRPPGPAFDPEDLASVPNHGRGLFLIHHLMDRVEIRRHTDRNEILLIRALPTGIRGS
ncbi:MAG: ATP-binding protein [Acidobacteriota bacterium]